MADEVIVIGTQYRPKQNRNEVFRVINVRGDVVEIETNYGKHITLTKSDLKRFYHKYS